jgi:hypothetical protein
MFGFTALDYLGVLVVIVILAWILIRWNASTVSGKEKRKNRKDRRVKKRR